MVARSFVQRKRKPLSAVLVGGLALVVLFSENRLERMGAVSDVLFLVGIVLIGIATVGRLWCLLYISGYKTNTLITAGPYSLCRNPLYFFSFLGSIGLGLATETITVALIVMIGFAAYYPLVIRAEERKLRKVHEKDFQHYMDSIPRFFPSFKAFDEPQEYTVRPRAFRRGLFDAPLVRMVGRIAGACGGSPRIRRAASRAKHILNMPTDHSPTHAPLASVAASGPILAVHFRVLRPFSGRSTLFSGSEPLLWGPKWAYRQKTALSQE